MSSPVNRPPYGRDANLHRGTASVYGGSTGASTGGRAYRGDAYGDPYGDPYSGGRDPRYGAPAYPAKKARPRWRRIALITTGLFSVLALFLAGCGLAYYTSLDDNLRRTSAFAGLTDRPGKPVEGTQNILLVGSDSRDGGDYDPKAAPGVKNPRSRGNERADTLMVLHIPEAHDKAYLISIPRDTYVFVPEYKGKGGRKAKINAAFAWGGLPLTVMTVERFTGVKMDHVLEIDFNGFRAMTDALGGVDVTVSKTVYDPRSKRTFKQGVVHLDGAAALDYVRQRYNLPRGDFDRVQRQQIFLRALLKKATDSGTITNPVKLKAFLDTATKALTVDEEFSLSGFAFEFRSIRASDLSFVTSPHLGSQTVDGQSVVVADKAKAVALWDAVGNDGVAAWLAKNKGNNGTVGR
ncbi:MAG TPA: LCP family protein [Cryptosporangiaceae bacterium]|nr:LCP family protein [Cryptosporangiaceae bacterium]